MHNTVTILSIGKKITYQSFVLLKVNYVTHKSGTPPKQTFWWVKCGQIEANEPNEFEIMNETKEESLSQCSS